MLFQFQPKTIHMQNRWQSAQWHNKNSVVIQGRFCRASTEKAATLNFEVKLLHFSGRALRQQHA
jgi:hypothetical protein